MHLDFLSSFDSPFALSYPALINARVIGYPARNGIVNVRISVIFNRIPSRKFRIQR